MTAMGTIDVIVFKDSAVWYSDENTD